MMVDLTPLVWLAGIVSIVGGLGLFGLGVMILRAVLA
jgi:hypothetical protein